MQSALWNILTSFSTLISCCSLTRLPGTLYPSSQLHTPPTLPCLFSPQAFTHIVFLPSPCKPGEVLITCTRNLFPLLPLYLLLTSSLPPFPPIAINGSTGFGPVRLWKLNHSFMVALEIIKNTLRGKYKPVPICPNFS